MKLIHTIIILILIYVILCARTCTDEDDAALRKERESLRELQDSIKQIFEGGIPDDQQLKSFEKKVSQKLIDFSEYMKIASDSSMDARLRKQAGVMAEELFISKQSNIRKWSNAIQDTNLNTIDQFINVCLTDGLSHWIMPSQINIMESLAQMNDSTFKGSLSFFLNSVSFSGNEPQKCFTGLFDIYLIKKPKQFGNQEMMIWEVCLGDMN